MVPRRPSTRPMPLDFFDVDVEQKGLDEAHLQNFTVQSFTFQGVTVAVKDRQTKQPKTILENVEGVVNPGDVLAIMGPSGSGKSTLLNALARRNIAAGAVVEGNVLVNGTYPSLDSFRKLSSYVEQDDSHIGSLTVRETLSFAARLAHLQGLSKIARLRRIDALLYSFGLRNQQHSIIGTPIRSGISGGQKRRVSVASRLITAPKLLFLDEPTSGLDSSASFEVITYIKDIAKKNNLLVIMSIHQPSSSVFRLFDKLLLLSYGKPHYFGTIDGVGPLFESIGYPMPTQINPAEFVLDLINIDFASDQESAKQLLDQMQIRWAYSPKAQRVGDKIIKANQVPREHDLEDRDTSRASLVGTILVLLHRSWIKSYRDIVAYGIRIMMYTALAIMMGTVWLRLGTEQDHIQAFINCIFFGCAFMSFMAVAYVPAYLEDQSVYVKEQANGLYGATAFMIANFIIGLPYLFIIAFIFSVISYWLIGFQPTAQSFMTWVMWLFLDLAAAESLVVFVSTIVPIFVASLTITAFSNGLWMSVGGFLVPPTTLNPFWKYAFHYIDYQAYVFQGMMVNEFSNRIYDCGEGCYCMFESALESQCKIQGSAILDQYGYSEGKTWLWVTILLCIILGYRLLSWLVLIMRT